jgi:hypothetical protein
MSKTTKLTGKRKLPWLTVGFLTTLHGLFQLNRQFLKALSKTTKKHKIPRLIAINCPYPEIPRSREEM